MIRPKIALITIIKIIKKKELFLVNKKSIIREKENISKTTNKQKKDFTLIKKDAKAKIKVIFLIIINKKVGCREKNIKK